MVGPRCSSPTFTVSNELRPRGSALGPRLPGRRNGSHLRTRIAPGGTRYLSSAHDPGGGCWTGDRAESQARQLPAADGVRGEYRHRPVWGAAPERPQLTVETQHRPPRWRSSRKQRWRLKRGRDPRPETRDPRPGQARNAIPYAGRFAMMAGGIGTGIRARKVQVCSTIFIGSPVVCCPFARC
jgi:hypothetical protein